MPEHGNPQSILPEPEFHPTFEHEHEEFIIENEIEDSSPKFRVEGRRIIDFSYFFQQLQLISHHDSPFNCNLSHLEIFGENRDNFSSTFFIQCKLCGKKLKLYTTEMNKNKMNLCDAFVSSIISIGSGFSNLEEMCSAIDVPSITARTYRKSQQKVYEWFEETKNKSMENAAKEERQLAIENGDVDSSGIPMISVVADGCWSKRSYRCNYSAASGAATIIGQRTGKILYMSVKNKYCDLCAKAKNKNIPAQQHKCFLNYTGPSAGMESTAILEGFKESINTHGLIYSKLIADGDSSTYKKILDCHPYPNVTVEKVECKNHLIRNYCGKIEALTKDTRYPLNVRKIIASRKRRLRKAVIGAIKYRKLQDSTFEEKVIALKKDLINGPHHVFGDHTSCLPYFCTNEPNTEDMLDVNYVPALKECSLFSQLMIYNSRLVLNSKSLIYNFSTNISESFNNMIAKFVGGKRINYSQRQSYMGRCAAAVIAFNTNKLHCTIQKQVYKNSPKAFINRLESRRLKINKKKIGKSWRKPIHSVPLSNPDYGENCQKPDMDKNQYQLLKETFLKKLKLTNNERRDIERRTVLQSECAEWLERRRNLLTASVFGKVCKRRENTKFGPLVKRLLYSQSLANVKAVKYGKENESIALQQLSVQERIKIERCGLFIDDVYDFIGATPDGISDDDTIIEIKCPFSAAGISADEAIVQKKIKFWKVDKDRNMVIDKNHDWYFQIQGQLHITKKDVCLFGVWTGHNFPVKIELIKKDETFWIEKIEKKIYHFYMNCLLPEIVDPRTSRSMNIREPERLNF
jgi:hypothetical protein